MAPELLTQGSSASDHSAAADVFSYGRVVHLMLSGSDRGESRSILVGVMCNCRLFSSPDVFGAIRAHGACHRRLFPTLTQWGAMRSPSSLHIASLQSRFAWKRGYRADLGFLSRDIIAMIHAENASNVGGLARVMAEQQRINEQHGALASDRFAGAI